MMTVRFPNGFSIQYNDANFCSRGTVYTDLYVKEGGKWIVQFPTTMCLIENVSPCRTYNAQHNDELLTELAYVRKELRTLKATIAKSLKSKES
jgi:hypothetical protein